MQEKATSKRFYQLTGIEPEPFLTDAAMSDISEVKCVLCHNKLVQDKEGCFCLIGRHKLLSEGIGWNWTKFGVVNTSKYAFQGAYVEICERCYTKYSRRLSSALKFTAIASVLALVLFLILVVHLRDKVNFRSLLGYGMVFAVFIIVGLFAMVQSFCDSKHFSSKTVVLNEFLPRYGVPDYNDSPYHEKELVSEEELLEVILDHAERDGD